MCECQNQRRKGDIFCPDCGVKYNDSNTIANTKYTSKCLKKAEYDEPIFVLRAKDPTAADTITHWVEINDSKNLQPIQKLREAQDIRAQMAAWRTSKGLDNIH